MMKNFPVTVWWGDCLTCECDRKLNKIDILKYSCFNCYHGICKHTLDNDTKEKKGGHYDIILLEIIQQVANNYN